MASVARAVCDTEVIGRDLRERGERQLSVSQGLLSVCACASVSMHCVLLVVSVKLVRVTDWLVCAAGAARSARVHVIICVLYI